MHIYEMDADVVVQEANKELKELLLDILYLPSKKTMCLAPYFAALNRKDTKLSDIRNTTRALRILDMNGYYGHYTTNPNIRVNTALRDIGQSAGYLYNSDLPWFTEMMTITREFIELSLSATRLTLSKIRELVWDGRLILDQYDTSQKDIRTMSYEWIDHYDAIKRVIGKMRCATSMGKIIENVPSKDELRDFRADLKKRFRYCV